MAGLDVSRWTRRIQPEEEKGDERSDFEDEGIRTELNAEIFLTPSS